MKKSQQNNTNTISTILAKALCLKRFLNFQTLRRMNMDIVKKCSTVHTYNRKNTKIEYICIHYTAGVSSKAGRAVGTAQYFATTTNQASADFIVDDGTIVQYNPDPLKYACWAVGGTKYKYTKGGAFYGLCKNMNSISIEIVSNNRTGKMTQANDPNYYFTDAELENAVKLTKYLMQTYGIDADHVIRHYDVTGKICPGIIGWNEASGDISRWLAFKSRLTEAEQVQTPTVKDDPKPIKAFLVKVLIPDLNIRRKPNMDGKVIGQTGKGTFTIVEERGEWGLLKSYASKKDGWIYLGNPKYTKRV